MVFTLLSALDQVDDVVCDARQHLLTCHFNAKFDLKALVSLGFRYNIGDSVFLSIGSEN